MGISSGRELALDTQLQRKEGLLFNKIDNEIVMLSVKNSEYYGMNKIGSRIWEMLEQPKTIRQLIASLLEQYEVTEEKCRKDALTFLKKLDEKKLLIIR